MAADRSDARSAAQPRRRWSDCEMCSREFRLDGSAIIHAAASVGIERGLTTNQALAIYMRERHAKHA